MQKLRLKPAASLMVDTRPNQLSFSQKPLSMNKQDTIENLVLEKPNFEKESDAGNGFQRQSSFLSYQNLSIDGRMSLCDSEFSQYNPSINEPFISDDADPDEKEMHAFLDAAGVFQINIKAQMAEEQKSACYSSPLNKLNQLRTKQSPSFMMRR